MTPFVKFMLGATAAVGLLAACGNGRLAQAVDNANSNNATSVSASAGGTDTISVAGRPIDIVRAPGSGPKPTFLVLHGGLSSADRFRAKVPIGDELAARGFNAAYLQGTQQFRRSDRATWNAGSCCGSAAEQNVDDVGYISQAINSLVSQGIAQRGRIYLIGHSNGAMMAYRYACSRPGDVQGVVAMSGPLLLGSCANAAGVRVAHIHGRRDSLVPVAGGGRGENLSGEDFPSVQDTISKMERAGAFVQVIILEGAEHEVGTVNAALQNERGQSIGAFAASFAQ
ncbi:PHB depolymerase family esterase [Roseivivax sp. THAF30]|uniref:alpha/beta hydrolase family esterase n=1 Tax=Roseivivax sp. THAF30 TaxID=2587852 RepID=UPI0012A82D61|nr:hypothetical protein [Roseivivax sp. THAF30]QFT64316.1 Alpha/beta hydrolase family protein [Roseivivax sp. THAF30]